MESSDFVDGIQSEKANALARYRMFTNMKKLFQLIEVFVAVAVISWSSSRLPFVFKFSGEYVFTFSSYFTNQHLVFLIGNVIVVVCYMLSRYSDSGNESDDSGIQFDDGRFSHVTRRKMFSDGRNGKPMPSQAPEVQIPSILNEKSVIKTESKVPGETKQIERFQRTQSDKLKRQIPVRELRRSMTVISGGGGGEESPVRSYKAVEKLSNEEFRIAVETFISKQQRFLKQQMMVEDDC